SRLYDVPLQRHLRDSLFEHPSPLFFEHPPFEALIFSPIAALPFRKAYTIWALFNAALWLLLIFFLRRHLQWPKEDLAYICLWLLFAPLGVALYQGQASLVLLGLYAITFVCLKRSQEIAGGLALGFGLFKFQFVLPFVLIFMLRRKWKFLGGFAISALMVGLLSLFTVGSLGLMNYARFLLAIGSNPQNESYGSAVDMPTLYGLTYAILGHTISHTGFNVLVTLLSVLLLVVVAWRWNWVREDSFNLMFSAAIAASLAASAHMFTHDFSPLVLPMFLVGAQLSGPQFHFSERVAMRVALILLWSFPIYFVFVAWHRMYVISLLLLTFVYSALRAAGGLKGEKQESRLVIA